MPTQALVRTLTRAQVDDLLTEDDKKALTVVEHGTELLIMCGKEHEEFPSAEIARRATLLQAICDADVAERIRLNPPKPPPKRKPRPGTAASSGGESMTLTAADVATVVAKPAGK